MEGLGNVIRSVSCHAEEGREGRQELSGQQADDCSTFKCTASVSCPPTPCRGSHKTQSKQSPHRCIWAPCIHNKQLAFLPNGPQLPLCKSTYAETCNSDSQAPPTESGPSPLQGKDWESVFLTEAALSWRTNPGYSNAVD